VGGSRECRAVAGTEEEGVLARAPVFCMASSTSRMERQARQDAAECRECLAAAESLPKNVPQTLRPPARAAFTMPRLPSRPARAPGQVLCPMRRCAYVPAGWEAAACGRGAPSCGPRGVPLPLRGGQTWMPAAPRGAGPRGPRPGVRPALSPLLLFHEGAFVVAVRQGKGPKRIFAHSHVRNLQKHFLESHAPHDRRTLSFLHSTTMTRTLLAAAAAVAAASAASAVRKLFKSRELSPSSAPLRSPSRLSAPLSRGSFAPPPPTPRRPAWGGCHCHGNGPGPVHDNAGPH
jgi:hypothetical protein